MQKIGSKSYLLLFIMSMCWSPSYLFIKLALEGFHPISLAFFRVFIGAILLFGICKLKSYKILAYWKSYKCFFFMGVFINALPFVLINFGEQKITSGLTAILLGMIPIFTVIFSHFFLKTERMNNRTTLGILTAFVGLVLIYLPTFYDKTISNETGILFILVAAFFYGSAITFAKVKLGNIPPIVCAFYQMVCASIVLIPFVLALEEPILKDIMGVPLIAGFALAIFGTAIAFFVFYESIRISGATFTSLNNLLSPVMSVLLGTLILKENLTPLTIFGATMILFGVFKINPYFSKKKN